MEFTSQPTEGGNMTTSFESDAREFARQFDTPNVRQAIALAEAGTLTWQQIAEIFRVSLAEGLAAVR